MSGSILWTNYANAVLAFSIAPTDTTLTVVSGQGALFPSPGAGQYFTLTLANSDDTIREITHVTARSGDVFTIVRHQEGTTALSWNAGSAAQNRLTAGDLTSVEGLYSQALGGVLSGTLPNPGLANSINVPGNPTTTTQTALNNSLRLATTQYVDRAVAAADWTQFQMGAFGTSDPSNFTALVSVSFTPAFSGKVLLNANAGCTGPMIALSLSGSGFTTESGSTTNFGQSSVGVMNAILDVLAGVTVNLTLQVIGTSIGNIGVGANYFYLPSA